MKDPNKAKTERMMVKRTLKNLELNRMAACYVETKEDALKLVKQIIPEAQSISTAMTKRFHPKAGSRMKGRHISPTSTSHLPTH